MTARRTLMLPAAPDTIDGGHWADYAHCDGMDTEEFFTHSSSDDNGWNTARAAEQVKFLRAICRDCPVIDLCLAAAIREQDRHAFRGGMTPPERRRYARKAASA